VTILNLKWYGLGRCIKGRESSYYKIREGVPKMQTHFEKILSRSVGWCRTLPKSTLHITGLNRGYAGTAA